MPKRKIRRKLNRPKWNWRPWRNFFKWVSKKVNDSWKYITAHWPRYLLSTVTATFTFHAAFVFTEQAYYGAMAVLLCEGMFLHWLSRLEVYENPRQLTVAVIMFTLACSAVILTDISSAILLAGQNDTFTIYSIIPDNVQWIVTNVTPILASTNLIAYGFYEFFSDYNADKREHARQQRELQRSIRASDRDMQKLRGRERILARKRRIERTQIKHLKRYGGALVSEANRDLKIEVDEKDDTGIVERLTDAYKSFFGKH